MSSLGICSSHVVGFMITLWYGSELEQCFDFNSGPVINSHFVLTQVNASCVCPHMHCNSEFFGNLDFANVAPCPL